MNRMFALALLLGTAPPAVAQDDPEALAAAFSQADLNLLGECQARVEGARLLLEETDAWLASSGNGTALDALRVQVERGAAPLEAFSAVRAQTARAEGMRITQSDAARTHMLETFTRRSGEDERAYYTRAQPETRLPPACGEALKRGRWKAEIDGLNKDTE